MKLLYLHTNILKNKDFFEKGIALISNERKEKIRNYKNEQTVRLSLGAGLLLQIAMDREGIKNKVIQYEKHGKPYLLEEDFYFNLSHSGEYVVCVYDAAPVGIDLQKVKESIPKHTEKILSEAEKQYLSSLNEEERTEVFYHIWSAKESVIKWDGRGLHIPLTDISVTGKDGFMEEIIFENKRLYLSSFLFQPKYAFTICSQQKIQLEERLEIDSNFLTKY